MPETARAVIVFAIRQETYPPFYLSKVFSNFSAFSANFV